VSLNQVTGSKRVHVVPMAIAVVVVLLAALSVVAVRAMRGAPAQALVPASFTSVRGLTARQLQQSLIVPGAAVDGDGDHDGDVTNQSTGCVQLDMTLQSGSRSIFATGSAKHGPVELTEELIAESPTDMERDFSSASAALGTCQYIDIPLDAKHALTMASTPTNDNTVDGVPTAAVNLAGAPGGAPIDGYLAAAQPAPGIGLIVICLYPGGAATTGDPRSYFAAAVQRAKQRLAA